MGQPQGAFYPPQGGAAETATLLAAPARSGTRAGREERELSDEILVGRDGAVATVTFNRPEVRNAISYGMWVELRDVAGELSADGGVRCVVFRGAGEEAFSAGADIRDFAGHRHDSASAAKYADVFEGAMDLVEEMPKPTITMIRGFCIGGGIEFATATDIRIASEDARFGVPIARISVVAGYKEVRRLVALVGRGNVARMLLGGEIIDAAEALRIGLVTSVVGGEELEEQVYGLARRLAGLAPLSHRAHKAVLRTVSANPGLEGLSAEERALPLEVFDSADFREGTAAFLEKRRPEFTGR